MSKTALVFTGTIGHIKRRAAVLLLLLAGCVVVHADESVHVAAASNFSSTLKILKQDFEASSQYELVVSTASTGKIYAQISNGAPFDVFLAADQQRPKLLVQAGLAHGPFTYAIGQLAVWHPRMTSGSFTSSLLANKDIQRIALANPRIAPYGHAAKQWISSQGQWRPVVIEKIVRGENVAQTLQFVQSGHAQLGFVAFSDILGLALHDYTLLDETSYPDIKQQAVHLNAQKSTLAFMDYLKSEPARKIILQHGYRLP